MQAVEIMLHSWATLDIHLVVCLTTGPKPLPKRALHIVRSRASSFKWEYPLLALRSSNSFLRLLPCLPVTSIPLCIFPSITRCKRQFLRKMWPIQFAFRLRIARRHSGSCFIPQETRGDAVSWGTVLQAWRSRVRFPMVSLTQPFRSHYDPGVESTSNRNKYRIYFLRGKGDRSIGLTTLPPLCADCNEIWEHRAQGLSRPVQGLLYLYL